MTEITVVQRISMNMMGLDGCKNTNWSKGMMRPMILVGENYGRFGGSVFINKNRHWLARREIKENGIKNRCSIFV